ncbi:hypothetical protein HRbin36_02895 [bacterium HR36]|nr:hypothetical protein HRbin36_02895 [bacterium HR36]
MAGLTDKEPRWTDRPSAAKPIPVMPEEGEAVMRHFPEPEWLPPPDYSIWIGIAVLLGLCAGLAVVVWWGRKRSGPVADPALQLLQTLLVLRSRLEGEQMRCLATGGVLAKGLPESEMARTTPAILEQAYHELHRWWRQWGERESKAAAPTQLLALPKLESFGSPATPDDSAPVPAARLRHAMKALGEIVAELQQMRFSGRTPSCYRLIYLLEQASALVAQIVCPRKSK